MSIIIFLRDSHKPDAVSPAHQVSRVLFCVIQTFDKKRNNNRALRRRHTFAHIFVHTYILFRVLHIYKLLLCAHATRRVSVSHRVHTLCIRSSTFCRCFVCCYQRWTAIGGRWQRGDSICERKHSERLI